MLCGPASPQPSVLGPTLLPDVPSESYTSTEASNKGSHKTWTKISFLHLLWEKLLIDWPAA